MGLVTDKVVEVEISEPTQKIAIAREFLDAAIEFFLAKKNFFCAIHLAAASEELLGEHLDADRSILDFAWKAEKCLLSESGKTVSDKNARKSVNEWKNGIKHADRSLTIEIDPEFAAKHHIEKALKIFDKLKLRKSEVIWKYEDYINNRPTPESCP